MGDRKEEKRKEQIIIQFNRHTLSVLKVVEHVLPNHPTVSWFKRIYKIARDETPQLLIEHSLDKIWASKEAIINRDETFFQNYEVDDYAQKNNKAWLSEIAHIMRQKYSTLSAAEKKNLWSYLEGMLKCVIEYRLIKGDFE